MMRLRLTLVRNLCLGAVLAAGPARAESEGGATAVLSPTWVSQQLGALTVTPLALAVQKDGFSKAALNQTVLQAFAANPGYTLELPTGDVMDQQNTGDCWIFSSLNVLRAKLYAERRIDSSVQFSTNYVYFYSLLEKTNYYLNYVIELRHKDKQLLKVYQKLATVTNLQDGGWWENVAFLVQKYGLVPRDAMPATKSAEDDSALLADLADVVGATVEQLRHASSTMDDRLSNHEQLAQLYAIKAQGLNQALRIIQAHLGTPPQAVTVAGVSLSPLAYFASTGLDFNDYVHLASYPTLAKDQHFAWRRSAIETTAAHGPLADVEFLNTTNDRLLDLVTNSVRAGYAAWIGIDVLEDTDTASGIMHPAIYDRAGLYGWPVGLPLAADPKDAMLLGILTPDHAVAVVGLDQPDPAVPPTKFKVENSWGTAAGTKGFFHMYREWFQQYVFDIVVPKSLLTAEELSQLQAPAKTVAQELGG